MAEILDLVIRRIKKTFMVFIIPVLILFAGVALLHQRIKTVTPSLINLKLTGVLVFIISFLCGVGVPILLRIAFQKKAAGIKKAVVDDYEDLQRKLIISVFISCLSAVAGYVFPVSTLYLYGAFFSCLYGVYSVLPYRRKIAGEMKFYHLI